MTYSCCGTPLGPSAQGPGGTGWLRANGPRPLARNVERPATQQGLREPSIPCFGWQGRLKWWHRAFGHRPPFGARPAPLSTCRHLRVPCHNTARVRVEQTAAAKGWCDAASKRAGERLTGSLQLVELRLVALVCFLFLPLLLLLLCLHLCSETEARG